MNKIFFLVVGVLALPISSPAADLTAVSVQRVIELVEKADLQYMGHGMMFGFETIESCLWKSKDLVVIQDYCFPKGNYPARAYEIWSREFGVVRFYEEKLSAKLIKRDVTINYFPESVAPTFPEDMRELQISAVPEISEKLYHRDFPGCWSTGWDWYSEKPDANCYKADISMFGNWAAETQELVLNVPKWKSVFNRLGARAQLP